MHFGRRTGYWHAGIDPALRKGRSDRESERERESDRERERDGESARERERGTCGTMAEPLGPAGLGGALYPFE